MIAVVTAMWLASAAPAGATGGAVVASPRYVPVVPPVVAGDMGLVWVERTSARVSELWEWVAGGRARRVQRFVDDLPFSLSASSTHVGLELFKAKPASRQPGDPRVQTFVGAFGGPLELVSDCLVASPLLRSVDASAGIVFRGPACDHATVRATGTGAVGDRRIDGSVLGMRLAEPYEAWLERGAARLGGPSIVVRDARSAAELTRAPLDELPGDVSLAADGTVATLQLRDRSVGVGDRFEGRLDFFDPGSTRPRVGALTVRAARLGRWVGSELAVVGDDPRNRDAGVLQLVDASGRTTRTLAQLGADPALLRKFDVNASRAVWVSRGCRGAQIRTIALGARAVASTRERCSLRLVRAPRVLGGRLRLAISCAGFQPGCSAWVTVRAGRRVLARGVASVGSRSSPHATYADLKISRHGLALLRNQRRVRVQISARLRMFGPAAAGKRLGEVTRRTAATINYRN